MAAHFRRRRQRRCLATSSYRRRGLTITDRWGPEELGRRWNFQRRDGPSSMVAPRSSATRARPRRAADGGRRPSRSNNRPLERPGVNAVMAATVGAPAAQRRAVMRTKLLSESDEGLALASPSTAREQCRDDWTGLTEPERR